MEPNLVLNPKLKDIQNELTRLEQLFHHPAKDTSGFVFESMTEPDFWEIGASGKRYSREFVLRVLAERSANPSDVKWQLSNAHCLEIAPDNFLLTYTLMQETRVTLRSTIWRRHGENWKIVYHQGTVVT
jgi:hypothetical protein